MDDKAMTPEEQKHLRRKIEDYLRKYASLMQLLEIAKLLGVKYDA
jgi:hypothetical protein